MSRDAIESAVGWLARLDRMSGDAGGQWGALCDESAWKQLRETRGVLLEALGDQHARAWKAITDGGLSEQLRLDFLAGARNQAWAAERLDELGYPEEAAKIDSGEGRWGLATFRVARAKGVTEASDGTEPNTLRQAASIAESEQLLDLASQLFVAGGDPMSAGRTMLRAEKPAEAAVHFVNAGAHTDAAEAFILAGKYREAIESAQRCDAWLLLAEAHEMLGDHGLAGEAYRRANKLDQAADAFLAGNLFDAAAQIAEQVGDLKRAAELLESHGDGEKRVAFAQRHGRCPSCISPIDAGAIFCSRCGCRPYDAALLARRPEPPSSAPPHASHPHQPSSAPPPQQPRSGAPPPPEPTTSAARRPAQTTAVAAPSRRTGLRCPSCGSDRITSAAVLAQKQNVRVQGGGCTGCIGCLLVILLVVLLWPVLLLLGVVGGVGGVVGLGALGSAIERNPAPFAIGVGLVILVLIVAASSRAKSVCEACGRRF